MKALVAIAVLAAAAAASGAGAQPLPVRIGLEGPDMDACGSLGEVRGLNRRGQNYLSVRAGPRAHLPERDRLRTGRQVFVCQTSRDGEWLGVVYGRTPGQQCNVGSPVRSPRPYSGRCRSGWVNSRYITIVAG
ncbi:MAG TPA: hypothetical protein VEX35_13940 [Allosphingosinicella sp.]|nr:hypothetical protein [Allosphingosinicella sp.]